MGLGSVAAAPAPAAVTDGIPAAAGAVGGDIGGVAAGQPQPDQNENDDAPPVVAVAAAIVAPARIAAHNTPSYQRMS